MKKVGKTDVSVIMPVYNTEPYLREALDSLLKQTNPNIEIICVDDGSTDASASILKEYTEKDPRVQILRQDHQGAEQHGIWEWRVRKANICCFWMQMIFSQIHLWKRLPKKVIKQMRT